MLSLMWSEHCAYKHSQASCCARLPTEGPHVLMGPGENAGAVDVGGGLAVAFKVESHNHPSAVEPFQGAATGVGGILRDVFAVGARPIAVLDSLRFGEPERVRAQLALPARARRGRDRPLRQLDRRPHRRRRDLLRVRLRAELPHQRDVPGAGAPRAADPLSGAPGRATCSCCSGPLTGRDGIGGASVLASAELGEGDEAKRPSVQIGDPFAEKKLLECCLELLDRDLLISLQDLGAAGLTSSASEMASKGEVGIDIDVCRVPLRERGHGAVRDHGLRVPGAHALRGRARAGGRGDRRVRALGDAGHADRQRHRTSAGCGCFRRGASVGDLPVEVLVDDCPLYDLEPIRPTPRLYPAPAPALPGGATPTPRRCWRCSARPTSPRAGRFSSSTTRSCGSRTVRRPDEADAAVLALPDGGAIAVSIDGNGRRVACDPRAGAPPRRSTSARPTWPVSAPSRWD